MTQDVGHAQDFDPTTVTDPTLATPTAHVQITTDGTGKGTVVIDDTDVSLDLAGVHLSAQAGQIPRVVLEVAPGKSLAYTGPALVQVPTQTPVGPGVWREQTREWLAGLNWQLIGARAAEGTMASPVHEAFRDALIAELGV